MHQMPDKWGRIVMRRASRDRLGRVVARAVIAVTAVVSTFATCRADGPGQQKALIIAVQNYDDPKLNLNVTLQDSRELRRVLVDRAGLPSANITMMNDESESELRPRLANVRREMRRFLDDADPEDRVLIFFTGHGTMAGGKTYLVPADFRETDPSGTGLPAAEIRTALNECKAAVKFLVLDCCQAGGKRGDEPPPLAAGAIAQGLALNSVANCVVLASCRAEEKSFEWQDRKQSVFTFWLCQALEGGADIDANGKITSDEVYNYCYDHVPATVSGLFPGKTQHPARDIGPDVQGVSEILTLRPESPESVCARLAMLMDLEARQRKLRSIGVLEFLEPFGNVAGLARSNLPAYCSETVRLALSKRAGTAYRVLDEGQFREVTRGLKFSELGSPDAMKRLGRAGEGVDAFVSGTLRPRDQTLMVACEMIATADGKSLASPSGKLPMTEGLLADGGRSFDNRNRQAGGPSDPAVLTLAMKDATRPNPLLRPDFPFRVEVATVAVKPGEVSTPATPRLKKPFLSLPAKSGQPDADGLFVAARQGEEYEVWVTNNSDRRIGFVLLIDGLNALGQKRERIELARPFVLGPKSSVAIGGWYMPAGSEGAAPGTETMEKRRFRFDNPAQTVAVRENFTDAIGTITAAFFEDKQDQSRGRLGTGEGPTSVETVKIAEFRRGRLLGAITVEYADEQALRGVAVPVGR